MEKSAFFEKVVLGSFHLAIMGRDVERIMLHAKNVADYVIDKKIEYAQDEVLELFESGGNYILTEEKITYLKYKIQILQFYGYVELAVKNMCECAYCFANASEFQSAYRILYDANVYAVENQNVDAVILTLEVQGQICLYEGDNDTALVEMRKAISLLESINKEVPEYMFVNVALAEYRSGNYAEAEQIYEDILKDCKQKNREWWGIKFNNLLCKFRLYDDINLICSELKELEEWMDIITDEECIEFNLIAAEVFLRIDREKAILYLHQAVISIERIVNENIRLHYRRGIREKYVGRIKRIIGKLGDNCELQTEMITILVFLKISMVSEWLALKSFVDSTEYLPDKEKAWGRKIIKRMENEGIPILYGYSEKYDDPFEEYGPHKDMDSINKMWNDFAELMARNHIPVETLYRGAGSRAIAEYMLKNSGDIYVFVESCAQGAGIWFNHDGVEKCGIWGMEDLRDFIEKYLRFQMKELSRSEYRGVIEKNMEALTKILEPLIKLIAGRKKVKVHFLTDYITSSFPFLGLFINNDTIMSKVDKNEFEYVLNPVLYISPKASEKAADVDFVKYDEENLSYQNAEFEVVSSKIRTILWNTKEWIKKDRHEEAIIHISSHGLPISRYTDPVFANIRGEEHEGSISIPDIQDIAGKANYNFVFINCCYGGTYSNGNYFRQFGTNELIGYNTAFMLNGNSTVLAAEWPVVDLVALFFAELFYQNIADGESYSMSYIKTVKKLYHADVERCKEIANKILEERARNRILTMLLRCPIRYPFKNIVDVGVYNFCELL